MNKADDSVVNSGFRKAIYLVTAAFYGIALGAITFLNAGFGHGTYIPLVVTSAPFGLMGIAVALFATPVLWTILMALAACAKKKLFGIGIVTHYVSAGLLLVTNYQEWGNPTEALPLFILWIAVYALGQGALWHVYRHSSAFRGVCDSKKLFAG